ncbi:MAG: hypothetical protein OEY20_02560 [Gemmatimonadota bacterium]|nr:hypothetical protein [Gemmatimonadota bacterium]
MSTVCNSPGSRLLRKGSAFVLAAAVLTACSRPMVAQAPPDSVTQGGVMRASAVVDAVFVERLLPEGTVGVGDWASYLMARLGVVPIPSDVRVMVRGDSTRVVISSRVRDLNAETRAALGPIVTMVPAETELTGEITLLRPNREVVQFYLATVRVNGLPLPDRLVAATMLEVGKRYPALSSSGRSLYVQVPADAQVELLPGSVRLIGPPAGSAQRGR